jgi:hypothetical protein
MEEIAGRVGKPNRAVRAFPRPAAPFGALKRSVGREVTARKRGKLTWRRIFLIWPPPRA